MDLLMFAERLGASVASVCDGAVEVTGCYAGDLPSDCLAHSKPGDALVTVILHENILAVAKKNNLSCVIASNTASVPERIVDQAGIHGINLLYTDRDIYHICIDISCLLKGRKCI